MCTITMTQYKKELGRYSALSQKEDILVLKNGKPYMTVRAAKKSNSWESFFDKYEGIIKEEELDLNDPITAGILGKLWEF